MVRKDSLVKLHFIDKEIQSYCEIFLKLTVFHMNIL